MPEENVRQLYILIEFSGYVLQIVSVLFLFFVPYEQKYLRVKKDSFYGHAGVRCGRQPGNRLVSGKPVRKSGRKCPDAFGEFHFLYPAAFFLRGFISRLSGKAPDSGS